MASVMVMRHDTGTVHAWRHARPLGVEGLPGGAGRLCIGHTDVRVDPRRIRRLARRIARVAQRNGLPRVIRTSPLQRCADVGRWLKRLGWVHQIDERLIEMHFGAWEGRPWSALPRAELDAWAADFCGYAPGGGESVAALVRRAAAWDNGGDALGDKGESVPAAAVVVTHAGWMRARRWAERVMAGVNQRIDEPVAQANPEAALEQALARLSAEAFPASPGYGEQWNFIGKSLGNR